MSLELENVPSPYFPLSMSPYGYNTSNQLTSTPAASFTFDNNGNTLAKADTDGTTNYAWDIENRLASVTLPNGGGAVTFKYDPFGRRIQKATSSGTTNYVYDGANVVDEYNASGALVAKYSQGQGIDEPLGMWRNNAITYYHADGLGSITSLTDSTGTAQGYYSYDSFGKIVGSPSNVTNPYRYTGREWDSETNLYYYRARYYDPNTGRFISEDPVRQASGSKDFYPYVENDPVDYSDSLGLARGNPQQCQSILDRINNLQREIDERTEELEKDPLSLPGTCPGDKAKPSLSRRGHFQLRDRYKADLAKAKAEYLANCSDDPPNGTPATGQNPFHRSLWDGATTWIGDHKKEIIVGGVVVVGVGVLILCPECAVVVLPVAPKLTPALQ